MIHPGAVVIDMDNLNAARRHEKWGFFNNIMAEYPDFKEQMIVIAESSQVPSNGLAVRKDLNSAIKLRIKTLLLSLHETPEGQEILKKFGALKFIKTSNDDYNVLYSMVNQLGIDLQEYSYKR